MIGFICNWCSYRAADLAGTSRIKYPPNVRLVRLMCSGRLDPAFVLKAFAGGADGVMVSGCWPGECHYIEQNIKALRRFVLLRRVSRRWASSPHASSSSGPARPRASASRRRSGGSSRRCAPSGPLAGVAMAPDPTSAAAAEPSAPGSAAPGRQTLQPSTQPSWRRCRHERQREAPLRDVLGRLAAVAATSRSSTSTRRSPTSRTPSRSSSGPSPWTPSTPTWRRCRTARST